ncbi:MAG: TIM barrel protein [Planctomycetaceae bacterium]|nr:TIM barrel protein [Planctomycetaceae bacterium]
MRAKGGESSKQGINVLSLKISVRLASLRQPFKKALRTAASLGAQAVEIDARTEVQPAEITASGIRHLRKTIADFNLKVAAVSFRTRNGYHVLENLDRRIEATKQAMQFAFQLGTNVVINQVGQVPQETDDPQWETLVQALSDLGRYGQHVGTFLTAGTGSESGPDLKRLIDAVPEGLLAVNLDPGNLVINGFSASEAARVLAPYVHHVHARDAMRDLARGRGLEVPLGSGTVDFPELLGILEEHRYGGYLTIDRQGSDNVVTEVAQAIQFLNSM